MFDERGTRLTPSHSQKQSKRYRYYVSESLISAPREKSVEGIRIPAQELETLVIDTLQNWLSDPHVMLEALGQPEPESVQGVVLQANHLAQAIKQESEERYHLIHRLVRRVVLGTDLVQILLCTDELFNRPGSDDTHGNEEPSSDTVSLTSPVQLKRCGHSMKLLIPGLKHARKQGLDNTLIQTLCKAHEWLGQLTSGKVGGVAEIAATEDVVNSHITRTIYRAFLAPDIVRSIMDGTQPSGLTADSLKQHLPLPIDWEEQRRLLGFK